MNMIICGGGRMCDATCIGSLCKLIVACEQGQLEPALYIEYKSVPVIDLPIRTKNNKTWQYKGWRKDQRRKAK